MKHTDKNCIFCKIIAGHIPATKLWEDKDYFIMLDISPINPGHTLVIPKNHVPYIFDMEKREYDRLMNKVRETAIILKKTLKPKRIGIAVEGFAVPHTHVHLIPLNKGNELNPERAKKMDSKKLNKIAEKIKKNGGKLTVKKP